MYESQKDVTWMSSIASTHGIEKVGKHVQKVQRRVIVLNKFSSFNFA